MADGLPDTLEKTTTDLSMGLGYFGYYCRSFYHQVCFDTIQIWLHYYWKISRQ